MFRHVSVRCVRKTGDIHQTWNREPPRNVLSYVRECIVVIYIKCKYVMVTSHMSLCVENVVFNTFPSRSLKMSTFFLSFWRGVWFLVNM